MVGLLLVSIESPLSTGDILTCSVSCRQNRSRIGSDDLLFHVNELNHVRFTGFGFFLPGARPRLEDRGNIQPSVLINDLCEERARAHVGQL